MDEKGTCKVPVTGPDGVKQEPIDCEWERAGNIVRYTLTGKIRDDVVIGLPLPAPPVA